MGRAEDGAGALRGHGQGPERDRPAHRVLHVRVGREQPLGVRPRGALAAEADRARQTPQHAFPPQAGSHPRLAPRQVGHMWRTGKDISIAVEASWDGVMQARLAGAPAGPHPPAPLCPTASRGPRPGGARAEPGRHDRPEPLCGARRARTPLRLRAHCAYPQCAPPHLIRCRAQVERRRHAGGAAAGRDLGPAPARAALPGRLRMHPPP